MTWLSRIKLFLGSIAVFAIVTASTLLFTQRQSEVASASADITADSYAIGTDYGGTVVTQNVGVGDTVAAGQELFAIQSLSLLQDLRDQAISFDTAAYYVTPDGLMVFRATVAGTVSEVGTKLGDFVQAGTDLAVIDRTDALYVVGDYLLTPRDYERIEDGAEVDIMLPNRTILPGTVELIQVSTTDGQAQAQIKVTSDELVHGAANGLVSPGTPVTATLHLRDDGPLAGVRDAAFDFLQQIGL
ncbi:MAG TPA: HlyD family efflux transporter periplasmic adaptor subunit [Naasia sp.]|jgi:multidrug resistance efflux pump